MLWHSLSSTARPMLWERDSKTFFYNDKWVFE